MGVAKPRLPFGPFTVACGPIWNRHATGDAWAAVNGRRATRILEHRDVWQQAEGTPTTVLAEITGVNRRTLVRWVKEGIPVESADEMAVAIGCHPSEIWVDWFDLVPLGVSPDL